ncbi:hypothetical protein K493DRAFT_307643 [Basidiobolus meristosporus CBS 931.73]|uniref:Uncharacterized protein n=1 Tax=Basidiobolus meristosporus CBS 931.73 TaxID=1314790 RepID=A0A1Y1XBV8_9FUNG|nr:hypothetical protein K493DRAFT_307643 [Basidiobolus meristosporus CBS 931.73]|eukprot:ORX83250.1 hypothetical protein K493DRAFT_307643 [Basidiobolus meristosporus CBS 931.73]
MTAVADSAHGMMTIDQSLHRPGYSLGFQNLAVVTQIFQKWQMSKILPHNSVKQSHPLSPFCQAGMYSLEFLAINIPANFARPELQLANSIRLLGNIHELGPDDSGRIITQVHRHQAELLNAIHLVYSEMDSVLKCSRGYRRFLQSEDREELSQGFSETILFAAQALSRGFQIRGIEHYTEELHGPAQRLCATLEALRYVFHHRLAEYPNSISLVGLFPVLMDFDQAWVEFERAICNTYFNINERLSREKDREEMREWSLWVDLMCSTLVDMVEAKLISCDAVKECDPTVFFALPRMSLLNLLLNQHDSTTKLKALSSHSASITQILRSLSALSVPESSILKTWLCGGEVDSTLANIHQIFTQVCAIVDPLQSGPEAKFFTGIMSKVLKRYINESMG